MLIKQVECLKLLKDTNDKAIKDNKQYYVNEVPSDIEIYDYKKFLVKKNLNQIDKIT